MASGNNQEICSDVAIASITFSTSNAIASNYDWIRNNTIDVTGLAENGSGSVTGTPFNTTGSNQSITYTVTPTSLDGCVGSDFNATLTVRSKPLGTVLAGNGQIKCSDISFSEIELGTTNGMAGTTFTWGRTNTANVTNILNSGSGNIIATPNNITGVDQTTIFTIIPTGGAGNGCVGNSFNTTLTVMSEPVGSIINGGQELCSNTAVTPLVVSTTNGMTATTTFNWVRNNTTNVTGLSNSGSGDISGTPRNVTSNPYTVQYTITPVATNTCTGNDFTTTIIVNPEPLVAINPAAPATCGGEYITIAAAPTGGTGTYSHAWTGSGATSLNVTNITNPSFFNNTEGPYSLTYTVTDAKSCKGSVSVTVNVTPASQGGIVSGATSVCSGVNSATLNLSGHAGSVVRWESSTDNWTSFTTIANTTTSLAINNLNLETKYRAQIKNGGCVSVNSSEAAITIKPIPIVNIHPMSPSTCVDTKLNLTASASGGSGSYMAFNWSGTGVSFLNHNNIYNPVFTGTTDGTYSLICQVTDANLCVNSLLMNMVVNPLPLTDITGLNTAFNVSQPPVNLTGTPVGGVFSGKGVVASDNLFYPNIVGVNTAGVYVKYTYIDANNCAKADSQKVVIYDADAYFDNLPDHICYSVASQDIEVFMSDGLATGNFSHTKGNGLVTTGSRKATLIPAQMGPGYDTIYYKYVSKEVNFEISKVVFIDSVSFTADFATRDRDSDYCINTLRVYLDAKNYYPTNSTGIWITTLPDSVFAASGHSATILPENMAKRDSSYTVKYYYRSPLGCESNTYKTTIKIHTLPPVEILNRRIYNYYESETLIKVNHPLGGHGQFSGAGIIQKADNNSYFLPSNANVGYNNQWTYTYIDTFGCSNSVNKNVYVLKPNASVNGLVADAVNVYCLNSGIDTLSSVVVADPSYTLEDIEFIGTGITNRANNTAVFDPSKLPVDTARYSVVNDTIVLQYYGVDKLNTANRTRFFVNFPVRVENVGVPGFGPLNSIYCEDGGVNAITGTIDGSAPKGGIAEFTGPASGFTASGLTATFNPSQIKILGSEIPINFTYTTTNLCKASITKKFTIAKLPAINFGLSRDTFFRNEGPVILGYNPDTIYSGKGVRMNDNNLYVFNPLLADLDKNTITARYTDTVTKCSNINPKELVVVNTDAQFVGINVDKRYCFDGEPVNISVKINNGIKGGRFTKIVGLDSIGLDKAIFDPSKAALGANLIEFKYTNTNGTPFVIKETIEVIKLAPPVISGIGDNVFDGKEYCSNSSQVVLTSDQTGSFFEGSGIVGTSFFPANANIGANEITCTYSSLGCSSSKKINLIVKEVAKLNFDVPGACFEPNAQNFVKMRNLSTYPEGTIWTWNFGDNTSQSSDFEPSHQYAAAGVKSITLNAISAGCNANPLSINVNLADKPYASFSWNNECFGTSKVVRFTSNSVVTGANTDLTHLWIFTPNGTTDTIKTLTTRFVDTVFTSLDERKIKLIVVSSEGCADTIEKQLNLRPVIQLSEVPYVENFESGNGSWFAQTNKTSDTSLWQLGSPKYTSAASGQNAWHTNISNSNIGQNAIVTSPCFDFTGMHKPMISMKIKKFMENRDGAVLQYTYDNGLNWASVGSKEGGINWYNSSNIAAQPGGEKEGWTSENNNVDTTWLNARYSLDSLIGHKDAQLRMVFGMKIGSTGSGLAFDDINISERSKVIMIEHFTNNGSEASKTADLAINDLKNSFNSNDYLVVNYHKNYPSDDIFYTQYPLGANSRMLDYNLSTAPYSIIEGGAETGNKLNYVETKWTSTLINSLKINTLEPSKFYVKLESVKTDAAISVKAVVKALQNLDYDIYTLQVAVVEKDVVVSGNSVVYQNVLRKMLPSPGGSNFEQSWSYGDSVTVNCNWHYQNVSDPKNVRVIAFFQNESTKEIYQAATDDPDFFNGTYVNNNKISEEFKLFPNPSKDNVFVLFKSRVSSDSKIVIYNLMGSIVKSKNVNSGSTLEELNINDLKQGIYLVKVENAFRTYNTGKLIITK